MALFKRKPAADDGPPDETLTFLSAAAAGHLRAELAAAFAEHGLEMQVFNDHLVDSEGREFGVHNIGAACFNDERGEKAWPEVIRGHVRRILADMDAPSPLESMTAEEARALVLPRLFERAGLPSTVLPAYARDFSDDIVEVFNLDLPDTVRLLDDEGLERLGGRSVVGPIATRNLLGVLPDIEVESVSVGEVNFDVVLSESMFTASVVLAMPELVRRLGIEAAPYGILVAVPYRSQVVIHVIRDATVVPSLNAMVGFAISGFVEGAGPLSPHVFWWHEGSFDRLTKADEDGQLSVEVSLEFQAVLEAVVG
jgi:hypothetical protein